MPSITYNRFDGGLDLRQGASVADANRLRVLKNAYVTNGKAIRKRPGLVLDTSFTQPTGEVGQKRGLFALQGKLASFSSDPTATPNPDSRFECFQVSCGAGDYPLVGVSFADTYAGETDSAYKTMSYPYVVSQWGDLISSPLPYYHRFRHQFIGPLATYSVNEAYLGLGGIPTNPQAIKKANRMWMLSNERENVFFCALKDATSWGVAPSTGADAGFLGVASEQSGSSQATALGEYSNKLVVFFVDSAQIWTVNADQTLNTLDQILPIGTKHPYSHVNVGNDLMFLSPQGIRSISQSSNVLGNLADMDVGSPVDALISEVFGSNSPKAIYYRNGGQAWFYYGTKALVYTFSQSAKINAWSLYEFPVPLDYITELESVLYVRSVDDVYYLSDEQYTDNDEAIEVEIELAFLDFKMPGVLKQILGMDAVFEGTGNIQHRYDPLLPDLITSPAIAVTGDSRARRVIPVELLATNLAPVITHAADEPFEMQALTYYFESLGVVP